MIPFTLSSIAALTGGRVRGCADPDSIVVTGDAVTDSREAQPGSLYVARIGEHADGHRFVADAARRGAVAALTSRPVEDAVPHVVVADTQDGFAAISRAVVDAVPGLVVVGITGSSGKTSTKDILGQVLARLGPTVAPVGSYNSEVGVPLTVCRITPDTRYLIVEMGARGVGHIRYLTTMAPPRIGVVLNVGTAHVGEFGSRAAIAQAKSELPAALPPDGLAVLNADDPVVAAMAAGTRARVVRVGRADSAQVRAVDIRLDDAGRAAFTLACPDGAVEVELGLVGEHHVGNALAVAAVARECGMALPELAAALAAARPVSRWRMEVTERPDGVTVVNDAYNANPDSMRAALRTLARLADGAGGHRRSVAVLGSMLELGAESDAGHAEVGELVRTLGIDELVVVGELALPLAAAAKGDATAVHVVPDATAAEGLLARTVTPGTVVLFKSSRDAGLRWLGDRIAAGPAADGSRDAGGGSRPGGQEESS